MDCLDQGHALVRAVEGCDDNAECVRRLMLLYKKPPCGGISSTLGFHIHCALPCGTYSNARQRNNDIDQDSDVSEPQQEPSLKDFDPEDDCARQGTLAEGVGGGDEGATAEDSKALALDAMVATGDGFIEWVDTELEEIDKWMDHMKAVKNLDLNAMD